MYKIILRRGVLVPSLIVIALSTLLITSFLLEGEFIARSVLNDNLDRAQVDIDLNVQRCCWDNSSLFLRKLSQIEFIENVRAVNIKRVREISLKSGTQTLYPIKNGTAQISVFGLYNYSMWTKELEIIQGRLPNSLREVAVDKNIAEYLNITINSTITILNMNMHTSKNFTVVGIIKLKSLLFDFVYDKPLIKNSVPYKVRNSTLGAVLANIEALLSWSELGLIVPTTPHYLIKIKRDLYANPWDTDYMMKQIKYFENYLIDFSRQYLASSEVYINNYLKMVIEDYTGWPSAFRFQLLYMILPGILISGITGIVVGWMYIYRRKKEIAILKARGFSSIEIYKLTIVEFLILGFLASLLNILLSILVTYLTSYLLFPQYAYKYDPLPIIIKSLPDYLIASFVFSFYVTMLEVLPPTIKALKIDVLEGISTHSTLIEEEKPPKHVYLFTGVGILSVFEIILSMPIFKYVNNNMLNSGSILVQVSGIIILILDIVLISSGPFALVYGVSGVIGINLRKLEAIFKKINYHILKGKVELTISHFRKKPSRFTRMLFILIILVGFTVESNLNASSLNMKLSDDLRVLIGSDINVKVTGFVSKQPLSIGLVEQMKNLTIEIEEKSVFTVVSTAYYEWTNPETSLGKRLPYLLLIGIDKNYFRVTGFKQDYLEGISIKKAMDMIFNSTGGLISYSGKYYDIGINDTLFLRSTRLFSVNALKFKVIGYLKQLPGLISRLDEMYLRDYLVMIVDKAKFWETLKLPRVFLIDVNSSKPNNDVIDELSNIFARYGLYADIYSYSIAYKQFREKSLIGTMISLHYSEGMLFLILSVFIIFMVNKIELSERRKEFAFLIARGYTNNDLVKMYSVEAFFISLVAAFIGVLTGLVFTLSLMSYVNLLNSYGQNVITASSVNITISSLVMPIVFIATTLLSSLMLAKGSLKLNIPRELRTPL